MTKRVTQLGGFAASVLALAATASADIKLNDNFSVNGYVASSYRYFDPEGAGNASDHFDVDAARINILPSFNPVSGSIGLWYTPNPPGTESEVTLLDASFTYDFGNGLNVTAGKFLSYLGFEAFDIVNMYQLSYANGDFLAPIPGYHSGLKFGYSDKEWSLGIALLDAVYGDTYYKADGELRDTIGFEAFLSYTGVENLTIWGGLAHQTEGDTSAEVTTYDLWVSYQLGKALIAAEYVYKSIDKAKDGYNWLVFLNYAFDEKISTTFRLSGEEILDREEFTKFTVAPAYKVTDNLTVRGEFSIYDYKNTSIDSATFWGVQGVFRF